MVRSPSREPPPIGASPWGSARSRANRSKRSVRVCDQVLFQMYWSGDRDTMIQRLDRAKSAGAKGIILTLDWSFANGRDWGSPWIPETIDLRAAVKFAPDVLARPALVLVVREDRSPARSHDPQYGQAR